MAGSAPFGRDDQPLLDVKIVGGKRVEITVDKFGRPLSDTKPKVDENSHRFRALPQERGNHGFSSTQNASSPPWIRGETPPKKVLKPLEVDSPTITRHSSRSSSRSSGFSSSPVAVLPPISKQKIPDSNTRDSFTLLDELSSTLQGLDTAKLKDAYLHFSGMDSTLTGFVDSGQVEQVFRQCKIPIDGRHLDAMTSKFMAARRPNWVNYEQLLKYINNLVRNEKHRGHGKVPPIPPIHNFKTHSLSSESNEITLKPNQISPRSMNDDMMTGRQSTMLVKHAFQDRQDAQLLIEMERLLKQSNNIKDLIWSLKDTLHDSDPNGNMIISTQKLKTICLHHHLPFNGSLLDRILDRFDPRSTGRVDWTEFISFVERAMPLNSAGSPASTSYSKSRHGSSRGSVEVPPSQPSWETRQPLQSLSKRDQVIPKAAAVQQDMMYDEHKRLLDEQLKDQSQQLSQILHKQQRFLDKRQKVLQQEDHIAEKLGKEPDISQQPQSLSQEQLELEEKHQRLLQQQFELIEQKRQINEEQEELNKYVSGGRGNIDGVDDNPVKSFLRLAHALFLYDANGTGVLECDVIRRLVTNYNLVYRLNFKSDVIEDAIESSVTADGMVSIDRLLDELKQNLTTG